MSRVAVITLSSLVLVGLIASVTFSFVSHNWDKNNNQKLAASSKAVQAICNPTDYKDACLKSLATVRTDDPKELIKAAFLSAKAELIDISKNSTVLKELEKDSKTAEAVKDCRELLQDAIDDFQRSFDEISKSDMTQANSALENLKIWLSATRTYQETCLDGFENTTGDASVKMRKVLQSAMEMSSNGLAIVNDLSSLLSSLDISSFKRRLLSTQVNRRLLDDDDGGVLLHDSEQDRRRRLLTTVPIVGHHKGEVYPEWVDGFRRKLLEATNLADDLKARANVVVAQDGSGKYKTIEEALKEVPKEGKESFIIYIKEGVYNEYLVLFKWMTNVVIVGDGPTKTRITNNKNFADGTKTFKTATLSVLGDFFMAKDIGVENTAGAIKHQAVAFRAQTDKSIFFNCHFDGYQDTLYAHTYRQFYRDCRITGTIDFIFGDAAAFFQNCTFVVRKPLENQNCIVTAQGRMERHQPTGIIIHSSKFESDPEYYPVRNKNKAYLGRPWKKFSKTIIMESQIDDLIQPQGWLPWEGDFALDTLYYGEYNNVGAGAGLADRVKWRGVRTIVYDRAEKFMPPTLFDNDDWIIASGIPYQPTLSSAAGPTSGIDEDPNAPAGAPSSFPYESSSSSGTTSHGGSLSSVGSTSSKSTPSTSKGSSTPSGTSSPDTTTKKSSHESPTSSSTASSSRTPSKGSHSSTEGGQGGGGGALSSQESGTNDSTTTTTTTTATTTTATDAPTQAPPPEEELTTPSPTPATSPTSPSFGFKFTTLFIPPMFRQKKPNPPDSSPSPSEVKKLITGQLKMGELERVLMSNEEIELEGKQATSPTPPPFEAQYITLVIPPMLRQKRLRAPASSPSPSTSPISSPNKGKKLPHIVPASSPSPSPNSSPNKGKKLPHIGPLKTRELERVLMSDEEMEFEDEASNDDMSGNVPDGDEPSPARVEPPSPSTSPSSVVVSPSVSPPTSTNGPSPSPSSEEVSDWLPPALAPEPGPVDEADKEPLVTSPKPKTNNGSKSKIELSMLLSGVIMWVALLI
ncbi:probable pectinesterase/pectinesterase inhibitor 21 [Chenopodium quinoa]|uniref:probable pectinesterase/pectinesterase inhibitor 21 n=1 Tax=Chenopodium quinoa TaxID=63459 RepID=UPI000B77FDD4|nr:probable pectinesterase/pectinesterase inhibitor 21 [Chenopodium quinoa]